MILGGLAALLAYNGALRQCVAILPLHHLWSSPAGESPRAKGLDSQRDPIECANEGGGSEEVSSEFVVARGDAAPILDAAEVVFDLVPVSIDALGTIGFLGGIAAARDDGQGTFVQDLLTHLLAVISLVGRDGERRLGCVQHFADDLAVMDLSARHDEVQRTAFAVDQRVDFRGAAAAADADRLIFLPPFAPLAARCAFTIVLSMR